MGKLRDELRYRTGHCSFEWAEEYEEKKRAERPFNPYRVQINHHILGNDQVVKAQSPSEALELLVDNMMKNGLHIDKSQYGIYITPEKDDNPFHTNVKVTKMNGIKRVSYYGLRVEQKEVHKKRMQIEQEKADWARREQYQGIY